MRCPHCDGTGEFPISHATLGNALAERRRAKKLTCDGLASCSGVSRAQIFRIESGVSLPSIKTLMKLAKALDYDVSGLIQIPNMPQKEPDK